MEPIVNLSQHGTSSLQFHCPQNPGNLRVQPIFRALMSTPDTMRKLVSLLDTTKHNMPIREAVVCAVSHFSDNGMFLSPIMPFG
jgi:hypothetical protein